MYWLWLSLMDVNDDKTPKGSDNKIYFTETQYNSLILRKKSLKHFKCFHINIRSLNKNYNRLIVYLQSLIVQFDVIILGEIWNSNIDIIQKEFPNYNFVYDPPTNTNIGGVAILSKKEINTIEIINPKKYEKIEYRIIQLFINQSKITIVGIYGHPNTNLDPMKEILKELSHKYKNLIILGDMNINLLSKTKHIQDYINKIFTSNYINHINHPTRITDNTRTTIDHIYSKGNSLNKMKLISGILINDISDHYATFIIFSKREAIKKEKVMTQIFSEGNINKYRNLISSTNWDNILDSGNINDKCKHLTNRISSCYHKAFPIVTLSQKQSKNKPWVTKGLIKCSKEKNRLYLKSKNSNDPNVKMKYIKYKKMFEIILKKSENEYFKKLLNIYQRNSKEIWKILNNLTKPMEVKQKNIKLKTEKGFITKDNEIAETFNNYFTSVGKSLDEKLPNTENYIDYINIENSSIFLQETNKNEVGKIIAGLPNKKKFWSR